MFECQRTISVEILLQFVNQIEAMKQRNYELKTAKVNFIVYWLKEGAEHEVKIILPELYFEKGRGEDLVI
ncbi:hypothetical protein MASR2M47_00650 [Draconibacterium sp.]